jgi:nitrogen fixation protein NifU and related proteins
MSEDIYQEQIIEWSKKADHATPLAEVHGRAVASNPLCGDRITVELQMDEETIRAVSCQVKGCILCKASSAILAELAEGRTIQELRKIGADIEGALRSSMDEQGAFPEGYRLFSPVRPHKSRHACVMLPFDAFTQAILEYKASYIRGK